MYELLLWRFGVVERCPVHRCRLVDACAVCGRAQPVVTHCVPMGHCVCCGHRLYGGVHHLPVAERGLDLAERWGLWRAVAASRLLAWSSARDDEAPPVDPTGVSRLLRHAVESSPDPSIRGRSALESALGVLGADPFQQLALGACPSLEIVLDVSMQIGVDPVRVVSGAFRESERSWPPEGTDLIPCGDPWTFAMEVREAASAERYPAHASALDEFIADSKAVDRAGLMQSQRTTGVSLGRRFPLRHRRARDLRLSRLQTESEVRAQAYAQALDLEIARSAPRSLVAFLKANGFDPSTLLHFEPERVSKLAEIPESRLRARDQRRDAGRAAFLDTPQESQVPTLAEVAKRIRLPRHAVCSMFPRECRELRARREREREARYARWRAAMRRELRRRLPRGVKAVAKSLGISADSLRRADVELYTRLLGGVSSVSAETTRRRASARSARQEGAQRVVRRLSAALRRELGSEAPRAARVVAAEQGVPEHVVYQQCPELVRELRDVRAALRLSTVQGSALAAREGDLRVVTAITCSVGR